MATTLEALIAQLGSYETYTPLSQDEMHRQASQRYQSVYDQKRLNAQKTYETEDAALAKELSGLQSGYDAQRASALSQNKQTYSQADRHALSRGMQRSSYNEGTLANIGLAGESAQRAIDQEQAKEEAAIGEKRTLLSSQLGRTLEQLSADQKNDELAYIDQLAAREYDRQTESRNTYAQMAMQLYEYQHQLEQEAIEQARWQAEFNARYGDGSRRSGSRRKTADAPIQFSTRATVSNVRRNEYNSLN